MILPIDWRTLLVPTISLFEIVLRGSVVYLGILTAMRLFRREAGGLSVADLLVVVLVADAAQNAMASEYRSITEGAVLIATIFAWDYLLDWLAFRSRWVSTLLHPPPLLLVTNGRIQRRNLRTEMITIDELHELLREQGIEDVAQVKRCYLEEDGHLSVIKREGGGDNNRPRARGSTLP
jgi:uncharacterized membrane protein YcaP (DUF421 family)